MSPFLSQQAIDTIRELRGLKHAVAPLDVRRAAWEARAAATRLPAGVRYRTLELPRWELGAAKDAPAREPLGGSPPLTAEQVSPESGGNGNTILLLHGGGYVSGNCVTHRELAGHLALHTGAQVVVVDYRRAPENPFPAAVVDAMSAYRHLLSVTTAERIALVGDSAGGGLSAALLLQAREVGLPQPAAAALLSPWLDLLILSPSGQTNAEADPSIVRERLLGCAAQYLAGANPNHALASPLHADLGGLAPLYINVGDQEVLLDDSLIFAERARSAGISVELSIGRGLWHVYPAWAATVPEAASELSNIGSYLRSRLPA